MATPESRPLKKALGQVYPQVWDATIDNGGGDFGDWRELTPADFAGTTPLDGPSGNIPLTAVDYPHAAEQVASGACAYGFWLRNDPASTANIYYGTDAVDTSHGDILEPGAGVWVPCTDSGSVYVVADGAGASYRGVRY